VFATITAKFLDF